MDIIGISGGDWLLIKEMKSKSVSSITAPILEDRDRIITEKTKNLLISEMKRNNMMTVETTVMTPPDKVLL